MSYAASTNKEISTRGHNPTNGVPPMTPAAEEKTGANLPSSSDSSPLALNRTTTSVAQEVTIRQVAPLVLVLTGATFLNTISAQAVVIILPQISKDLDIPETRQQWIVSAYALTSAAFLLLFGKLADVYGKRLLFILGCFWIVATTLGSAFSPVEVCIFIMRALAGLGAAVTIPTAIGIIGHTIPPGRVKNYSFAFYSGGAPIGQVMGNLLGGIISNFANWKVVFFVIGGASGLIGLVAIFVIPKEPPRDPNNPNAAHASGVDWIGAFLFTSGLLIVLIALSEGVSSGWNTPMVITFLVVGPLFLASFIYWQHWLEKTGTREPLMRVSTFKNSRFSYAMAIVFFFSAAFTNYLIYSTY
ncbi:Drug resistance protein [Lachnellula suecica]|uniref:Drug resistance protein n=1 Tax=Lachnellula suecica TaxID=602035 RepID=A0A8T9BR85_9HELO|nr:Drug resistance protein [Lachnellula suecica]